MTDPISSAVETASLAAVAIVKGINDPDELRAALERARVVGVLDAWAVATMQREECGGVRFASWETVTDNIGAVACELTYQEWSGEDDGHWVNKVVTCEGATADEARAKAALAIENGLVE